MVQGRDATTPWIPLNTLRGKVAPAAIQIFDLASFDWRGELYVFTVPLPVGDSSYSVWFAIQWVYQLFADKYQFDALTVAIPFWQRRMELKGFGDEHVRQSRMSSIQKHMYDGASTSSSTKLSPLTSPHTTVPCSQPFGMTKSKPCPLVRFARKRIGFAKACSSYSAHA